MSTQTTGFNERNYGLRNGAADLITLKPTTDNGFIVLAKASGVQPFVTWWAQDRYGDGLLVCSSGHYYETIEEAVADYQTRS